MEEGIGVRQAGDVAGAFPGEGAGFESAFVQAGAGGPPGFA